MNCPFNIHYLDIIFLLWGSFLHIFLVEFWPSLVWFQLFKDFAAKNKGEIQNKNFIKWWSILGLCPSIKKPVAEPGVDAGELVDVAEDPGEWQPVLPGNTLRFSQWWSGWWWGRASIITRIPLGRMSREGGRLGIDRTPALWGCREFWPLPCGVNFCWQIKLLVFGKGRVKRCPLYSSNLIISLGVGIWEIYLKFIIKFGPF